MHYFEVTLADGHYRGNSPLTYSSEDKLPLMAMVSVPLRSRLVNGFITAEVDMPQFKVKPIKAMVSKVSLPYHCLQLASWMQAYYSSSLGEALRQFAPTTTTMRRTDEVLIQTAPSQVATKSPLTEEQKLAITAISKSPSTTVLLHGETGSGKTRVYLELAKQTLGLGKSVLLLTPEISLTTQLARMAELHLDRRIYVLHSQLTPAKRKKIWFEILESKQPVVIVGARSALFSPVAAIGLIVLDEAHEPAYKQEQSPRYHASRVASQLGSLTEAKVVLGTATPSVAEYYLAASKGAVVRMTKPALGKTLPVKAQLVDLKDRSNFSRNPYFSNILIDEIATTLSAKKQIIIYLNRRGSARLILCRLCGWHFFCPNCDIPLTYHGDQHLARCHICGYSKTPPVACPKCSNPEIIYRTAGTKSLIDDVQRLFPDARVNRFDSDNLKGEHLNDVYADLVAGKIDILVGTQQIAKGLDLPRLGLVGIIAAEASLSLPDYTSEERSFQLLYQVVGRVGRGHGIGRVIVQSYDPTNIVIRTAVARDWDTFYNHALIERRQFRFPPFSYLLQLVCKRATEKGALAASGRLKQQLTALGLPVEIIGPSPSFYARRGKFYHYQLVVKAKDRKHLVELAAQVTGDWQVNLDPADLL